MRFIDNSVVAYDFGPLCILCQHYSMLT